MRASEYDLLRMVEDQHWWHRVLRGLVLNVFAGNLPPRCHVLDAGCGTGGMLVHLQAHHPFVDADGIDISALAVQHCLRRGLAHVRQGTVNRLPFEAERFDVVLCLDVLYHAEVREHDALGEMSRVLRAGGLLVANVPAFECLRGAHDAAVCGTRRYTLEQLRELLAQHGLHCEVIHYWNAWLFLPLLVWRHLSRLPADENHRPMSDLAPPPAWLNHLLALGGKWDARLCRALHVPVGSSVFAVARKSNASVGGFVP